MNILFFTRCMGSGGTEKVILQLCKALIGEGHRVIVCAASGNGVEDLKENKIRYYEIPDIQKKSMAVFIRTIHILLNIIKREKESVIFTGFQKNILNIIRQLDLVVLSSLWEGFPLTPIETFSMKKTIVVTDVPGNIEIVENRKNGLVVEKKNGIAIANAVVELYENKDYKKRLEENAYDTYVKEYSYQAFCSKYLELYHRTEEKYEQSFS